MDVASILSTSVPSYFVIGPLAIVFVVLIVLVGKKDTSKNESAPSGQSTPQPVVTAPVASPAPMPVQAPAEPVTPTPSTPPLQTAPHMDAPVSNNQMPASNVAESVPAHAEPVMESIPTIEHTQAPIAPQASVAEAPHPVEKVIAEEHVAPVPAPAPVTPAPKAVVPPISSWKPVAAPIATASAGESEADMQAKAMAHESGKEIAKEIPQEVSVATAPSEVVMSHEDVSSALSPMERIEMAGVTVAQPTIESQPQPPAVLPSAVESRKA